MRSLLCLVACAACGSSGAGTPDATPDAAPVTFTPASGTTMVLTATMPVGAREVVLFVPAFDYDRSQAYLLFVNDGQDATALRVALTLDDLWTAGTLQPMVVAALPVTPGGVRLQDYGTAEHDVSIACDPGNGQALLGTAAGAYARYVIDDALPAVVHATGIVPAAQRTGFLGASLGGLSAFSIAWDHPEVFGLAGALSGSFWWRTMSGTVEERQQSRIMQAIVARSAAHPGFRAWLEAGTDDETADRDGDGIIDAIDDTLDLIAALTALGFHEGVDVVYDQVEHGAHAYPTWSAVLPDFLRYAAGK